MDIVEDLLFGAQDSPEPIDDPWQDDFDDEQMLDIAENGYETDFDLFDTQHEVSTYSCRMPNSPRLASACAPIDSSDDLLLESSGNWSIGDAAVAVDASKGPPCDRPWVIAHLERILESIVDGLLEGSERLTFTLKSRANITRRRAIPSDASISTPAPRIRQISFPGNTAQEAWNFTVLLRLIELIHGGLVNNTIMTKRDIYYRHPDLFVKQAVVDRYVDDLACTLDISRSQLNVTAAAKGLVVGCFSIHREDGTLVDGLDDKEGMLVPRIRDTDHVEFTQLSWILVIEKEATFRSIISSSQWAELSQVGMLLTVAKGYPDLATRLFLHQLTNRAPHVPLYAFVDLDPDGIAIMSTYKYGSFRLAHEDLVPKDLPALSLPNLRWLGVKRQHISRLHVQQYDTHAGTMPGFQGFMRLTPRDRIKAIRMLQWDLCSETGPEQEWRHELQSMLMLNVKAEMQVLDELPEGLFSFLHWRLSRLEEKEGTSKGRTSYSDDVMLI